MKSDISKGKKSHKAAYLNVGVWYEPDSGQIHMTLPNSDWFHTTVNNNPNSERRHHSLFVKLARALKEADLPYPEV
jgi:hypothetical protein